MKASYRASVLLAAFVLLLPLTAVAEDVYVVKSLGELKLLDGKLPPNPVGFFDFYSHSLEGALYMSRGTLDGGAGELFVLPAKARELERFEVVIRGEAGRTVRGRLVLPVGHAKSDEASEEDAKGRYPTQVIRFQVELPAKSTPDAQQRFLVTRAQRYEQLLSVNIPGGAWFRQQVRENQIQLNGRELETFLRRPENWRSRNELAQTFELFSGGAAVSENLQIDRLLPEARDDEVLVPIDSLQGITVREFDWKPLVKDLKPETDPLARRIPFDQHGLFFASFAALISVADEADAHGTPILRAAEPRGEDAQTRQRYERQLCLPSSAVSRLLGPHLVRSVAVTGSDPYLRAGSDVAVLFQANSADVLRKFIDTRVAMAGSGYPEAKPVHGDLDGVAYSGMVSPDRVICSYAATLGDTVVVTNSLAQLKRLVSVQKDQTKSLATLDEYTFFRDRYRRGSPEEMALLVLSDATIRRWCGPKWRIANSRRTRAQAVIAEVQAENMARLVTGDVDPGTLLTYRPLLDAGKLSISRSGVRSSNYGSLGFATPIVEQDLTRVTETEARFYGQWRDSYQQNWSNFFDPIGARIFLNHEKLAVDVTVMPLIDRSQYSHFLTISRGAQLTEAGIDPHAETLAHLAVALNHESPELKNWIGWTNNLAPGLKTDPLSWVGNSVAVYADNDPFWDELAKAKRPERFLEDNLDRLPVVLQVEVRSPFKLVAFLATLRTFIEQSAPGMTDWETKEYRGQSYVRVTPSAQTKANERRLEKIALCYAPAGDVLIVTLNEKLLKQALDRRAGRKEARQKGLPIATIPAPWLGSNVALHLDRRVLELFEKVSRESYQHQMQQLSWSNLPILNEWHRLFPTKDPVAVHEQIWQRRLVCPGGGKYRWNETWQTMESTVYGHPGEPKTGPGLSDVLRTLAAADFGLTFEKHGLRGRAELTRATATSAVLKSDK